jgi:uncharacterized metal-binding protein
MDAKDRPKCGLCAVAQKICLAEDGKGPEACPTLGSGEAVQAALTEYDHPETRRFAHAASVQEAQCYSGRGTDPYACVPTKTRLEEIAEFARRMGYRKLGLAFCGGVHQEARILVEILENRGFEIVSVMCKVGRIPKERIGIEEQDKIFIGGFECMCNPIAQAQILNREQTEFNIMMGLCVGHDSLFLKHAQAYTTVFAVKDRVLGHNPMAALYLSGSYYARLRKGQRSPT